MKIVAKLNTSVTKLITFFPLSVAELNSIEVLVINNLGIKNSTQIVLLLATQELWGYYGYYRSGQPTIDVQEPLISPPIYHYL